MTNGEAVNWLINITADIGKAEHSELWHYEQALSEIREMLESEPERKKGKWIDGQCSICGCDVPAYIIDWKWEKDMDANYCPNCGADMRGREDE